MIFKHTVPIFYSSHVPSSLAYYTEVLGFEDKWGWGDPPTFGGVSKNSVEIFFCEKGQGNPGTWCSIMVDDIDEYYKSIKTKGAKILSTPETMEWGIREMLVQDPDGHIIRFGSAAAVQREQHSSPLPASVKVSGRMPGTAEINRLAISVGWSSPDNKDIPEKLSPAVVFAAVAEDTNTGEMIGCGFLLSDNTGFYYVRNVMVHPAWQNKHIGTALMQELTNWLQANAPDKSSVYLHTGPNLSNFYKQFGFREAYGMFRSIRKG